MTASTVPVKEDMIMTETLMKSEISVSNGKEPTVPTSQLCASTSKIYKVNELSESGTTRENSLHLEKTTAMCK
jgi:hypothetical protein